MTPFFGALLHPQFAYTDPEQAGYVAGQTAGQIVLLVILILGIAKCWSISRRPGNNTKCILALAVVLSGFFLKAIGIVVLNGLAAGVGRLLVLRSVAVVYELCLVVALVLAIMGLREMSQKPLEFNYGRSQGIWAIVLAVICGLAFIGGANTRLPPGPRTVPGQVFSFPEFNFTYRAPNRPWVSFNSSNFNKASKLGFIRRNPEVYFLVVAEELASPDVTSAQLAEMGKSTVAAAADSVRVVNERPVTLNGISGNLVESEIQIKALSLAYQHWYVATNGYGYQLVGYGALKDRDAVASEMKTLCARFKIADPKKFAQSSQDYKANFISSNYNYVVMVAQSGWSPIKTLAENHPRAEFGAKRGDTYFVVVPIALPGDGADLDSLTAALFSLYNIRYPNEELKNRRDFSPDGLEGVRFDFERDVNKLPVHYRLAVARTNNIAYLIMGWSGHTADVADPIFDDAFSRIRFHPLPKSLLPGPPQYTARELKTQAYVLNQIGLYHFNLDEYEQAIPFFRSASQLRNSEKIYVMNALKSWAHLDRAREASEFIQSCSVALQSLPDVRAYSAYFQAETGAIAPALTNYAALFAEGYHDEAMFEHYVKLLNSQSRFDESLAAIDAHSISHDSLNLRLLKAETYRLKSDFPKAIAILKTEHENAPFDLNVSGELAETDLSAGLYNNALDVSREMVKTKREQAYAYYLKGRSELGLKWYREAKTSFESAVHLAPANKLMNSYLEHVSAMIGEGSSVSIKEPIEPVAIPAAWTNDLPAPADGYAAGYGAYFNRRITAIAWDGKEKRTTEYIQAKMLDSSGVSSFSTLQEIFDPLNEEMFVNEVRVVDARGNLVSTGKHSDYYVLDERPGEMATHRKVLNVPISGLLPGCQLFVTMTRREFGKLTEFPFVEHCFSRHCPVRESIVLFHGDASQIKYRTNPNIEPQKLAEGLCWRQADPQVVRYEPLQPPLASYAPMLWIADANAGWTALATDYLQSIADHLETDASVVAESKRVTAGLETSEAKMAALVNYVQTNYVYKAIEFGRRARIPNKPAEIIHNKYGDCKDHAVLLSQMLKAVGLPAELALVNHNSPIVKELPSMDQFDHMIVFASGNPGKFIDVTDKGTDPNSGFPTSAGDTALVLSGKDSRLVRIPSAPPEMCAMDIDKQIEVIDAQTLRVREVLTARGVYGAYLRSFYQSVPATSRETVFQQQMGLSDFEVSSVAVDNIDDTSKPFRVHYSYTTKKHLRTSESGLGLSLPAPIERLYLVPAPVDKRLTPFEVRFPLIVRTSVSIDAPAGYNVRAPSELNVEGDPRFVACTCKWSLKGRKLEGAFQCRELAGKFKASEYASYRDTMNRAISALERDLVFSPMKTADAGENATQ